MPRNPLESTGDNSGRFIARDHLRETYIRFIVSDMGKTIEIKNRFTGVVVYSTEVDASDAYPMRTAVIRAVSAHADLAGADLAIRRDIV